MDRAGMNLRPALDVRRAPPTRPPKSRKASTSRRWHCRCRRSHSGQHTLFSFRRHLSLYGSTFAGSDAHPRRYDRNGPNQFGKTAFSRSPFSSCTEHNSCPNIRRPAYDVQDRARRLVACCKTVDAMLSFRGNSIRSVHWDGSVYSEFARACTARFI
ncbi:hypothetical protein BD626DRAFT_23620 [Schizophyllum amplum]|uniref:Uncharacterized protein n=1 Tax=Schizophyllum amplum TaxID=97359 RepID=A0A550CZA8_9AGAR|nr:hypothetical protein BD626DRAFT_23620 [Auriculariopsis ampla]